MEFTETIKEFINTLEDDAQKIIEIVSQFTRPINFLDIPLNAFNSMITLRLTIDMRIFQN